MWRGICLIFLSETVLCAVWWLQVWCSHLINRPTHDKTKSPSEGTQKATWTEHVNTMKLVKLFLDGQSNLQACFCLEQVHTRLGRYSCRGILPSLLILRVSSGLPPASQSVESFAGFTLSVPATMKVALFLEPEATFKFWLFHTMSPTQTAKVTRSDSTCLGLGDSGPLRRMANP